MLEPHEQPPEIVAILIDPVVGLLHLWQLQKAKHLLLQLTAAFTRNDLQHIDAPIDAEFHRLFQCPIDLVAFVEDVVEVDLVFGHYRSLY